MKELVHGEALLNEKIFFNSEQPIGMQNVELKRNLKHVIQGAGKTLGRFLKAWMVAGVKLGVFDPREPGIKNFLPEFLQFLFLLNGIVFKTHDSNLVRISATESCSSLS